MERFKKISIASMIALSLLSQNSCFNYNGNRIQKSSKINRYDEGYMQRLEKRAEDDFDKFSALDKIEFEKLFPERRYSKMDCEVIAEKYGDLFPRQNLDANNMTLYQKVKIFRYEQKRSDKETESDEFYKYFN